MSSISKISHYTYASIPKSEKNLKSETILAPRISDKGHSTYLKVNELTTDSKEHCPT